MPSILILSGSPIKSGSTELLLREIARGIQETGARSMSSELVRLNDYMYLPCQSCGKSPEPDFCFFHDEIYPVYNLLLECEAVLFGSPVYFDSISAQAKLFIDRCNCLRPIAVNEDTEYDFKKIITQKRAGAMVLVAGERQDFEPARKVMAGFFKWAEIENCGLIKYGGTSFEAGAVGGDSEKLREAYDLGCRIGSHLDHIRQD